jgi:hypothetical protein
MANPDKAREPASVRENKAGAMRWAVGAVVVLLLGAIAWWMSDPRGEPTDPTPRDMPGEPAVTGDPSDSTQPESGQSGINQPAVAPDADSNTGTLDAPQPATSGAGTQ